MPANGCGTEQVFRNDAVTQQLQLQLPAAAQRTIYLNRFGGTYNVANASTNSATNVASTIVAADNRPRTAVIPPLASGFNWTTISNCVKNHYAPYNIKVVETEPTTGPYIEAVVGGFGTELGYGQDVLFGIASADNFCGVTESGIAFSFSETHRGVGRQDEELCATIAHEVGHLITLEHEITATDLMSYVLIQQSGSKTFVNAQSQCGTDSQNVLPQCSCGGNRTNSAARLTSALGLRSTETVPPVIELLSPGDNAALTPTFEVVARATDDMAMEGVTVFLNGLAVGSDAEPDGDEYRIAVVAPSEGAFTLVVEATDQAGNKARDQVAVTIARLAIGETCVSGDECSGDICVGVSSGMFCTQTCDPSDDTCPDGFACDSDAMVCNHADDGGCCSTGGASPASTGLLLFAVGAIMIRRRKRAAR